MDNSAIQTLEAAAQMLMAPPNMVTSEQRHQAESMFLEFRTTKNPYALCREILEKSTSHYVLFEAAGLMKSALIREWSLLSESDISSLREYLLNYLLRKDTPPFLREKLLQTIAIIIKRGSVDDGGRERKALLTELEKLILSSPINQQKLACSLILAIMQEYAITVKSADVGMIWEVHFRLKKTFEAVDLKRIFKFTVGVLEQIIRSGHRPEGEQAVLTKQLLTIVATVLCWSHVSPLLSKRLIGAFEAIFESDTPALRLSMNWRDTMLKPELIALFFEIHMYVRSNPDLANPSLTCLVQLASLCGVVLSGNMKKQYLDNYVNSFLNIMQYIQPVEREMLGISDIYRKLVQFFSPSMIADTPPAFLENLTRLTCHCIRGAITEEGANEDTVWRESLNKFLHTWSSLVHDSDGYKDETLMNPCIEIFNTYLQCRLAPPDGTRFYINTESNDDIKDDLEEDERKQHESVLLTIGAVARKAPAHCSRVLYTLLRDRSNRLEGQLQLMHMGKLPVSGGEQLDSLFEDLHWILMITGHFLAIDCVEGELVMVPPEIVQFSVLENANIDASLRYLVGESTDATNVDPVLKLVGEILRVSSSECAALEAGLGAVFSPELSATVSWLLKIWANSYLMYSEGSPVLEVAFGPGSRCVGWVVSRLAARVLTCLRHHAAQPPAARQAVALLATLAHTPQRQHKENPLVSCPEFLALVSWEAAGSNLPGELRKELHRAFAITATHAQGEARSRLVSSTVALQEKLNNMLNMAADTEPVRTALADTLDCFVGVTHGALEVGAMDEQYLIVMDALEKVPGILFRYHNYPGVVLPAISLLAANAKRMLNSQHPHNHTKFVEICSASFDVYARWNQGKISSIPADAEEEAYEDICALMELICSVARCGGGGGAGGGGGVEAACARGLRLLLPLVTPPLLALPALAANMYRMIRDLATGPDQIITSLPLDDFNMVISALRVGLTAVSCDVSTLCCDTVVSVANNVRNFGDDNPYALSLLTLAELLLMLIIKMEIPPDSIPSAGAAIYSLTCVKPVLLEGLARQLIEAFAVNDPANVPRLEEAFGLLTNGVIFDGVRQHKLRFQDNFDKFLASVHGFLIVK